jgi:hypothetical protein
MFTHNLKFYSWACCDTNPMVIWDAEMHRTRYSPSIDLFPFKAFGKERLMAIPPYGMVIPILPPNFTQIGQLV